MTDHPLVCAPTNKASPVGKACTGPFGVEIDNIWVWSRNCGCLVNWFCYQLITKPGNKTATVSCPDPYESTQNDDYQYLTMKYYAITIFRIYFPIHSYGIILWNKLCSWTDFVASNPEQKIYSFYLQHLFDILNTLDPTFLLLMHRIKIVLVSAVVAILIRKEMTQQWYFECQNFVAYLCKTQ